MNAIRITGHLARDAQARYTPEGQAWLFLDLDNGAGGLPVEARRCMGQGSAAQIVAARTAHRLRRGCCVTIHADSYRLAQDTADTTLLLTEITHIEHQAGPAYHEQPEPQEAA